MVVDSPPRIEVSQPEGSDGSVEPPGDAITGRSSTPIYHDPHPPFETDGRGRVVWSNSSEQARLRSRSSPPVQLHRKPSNDETGAANEKENCGITGPGIRSGDATDVTGDGQGTGVEGATAGAP